MHKVFISYHHEKDQHYKNELIRLGKSFGVFVDRSVDTGDIPDHWDDQAIRKKIRDEYLRDSTVTVLLVGLETKRRKHIDWEIYSSMFDGVRNKKSGVLVVNLPDIECWSYHAAFGETEKKLIYPDQHNWKKVEDREEYERRYPHMPERIIDNLVEPKAHISVVPWKRLDMNNLKFLIDSTFNYREKCNYDLSKPMRRRNT